MARSPSTSWAASSTVSGSRESDGCSDPSPSYASPLMLGTFSFNGTLRPAQQRAMEAIQSQLDAGNRRLHIVAPPGSGKTVLGLYVWAHAVRTPAVVLSPTSAIQSQWLSRASLFGLDREHVSDDPSNPALLTSITYQSVTMPRRADAETDEQAQLAWAERLVAEEEADDLEEARQWILDLSTRNPAYYRKRLAVHRRGVIEELTRGGRALDALHDASRTVIERLRDAGVGLVILDECHHLLGHWGRVLDDAHDLLDGPVVLGLTATPPDGSGKDDRDFQRYSAFLGPVDFEVPVPAVVKEGHLAPYQDLVQFVRPLDDELRFVASADQSLHELVDELCADRPHESAVDPLANNTDVPHDAPDEAAPSEPESPRVEPMPAWVHRVLRERLLPTGPVKDWESFVRRDRALADFGRVFLKRRGDPWPEGVPPAPEALRIDPPRDDQIWLTVIDRYVRHALRRSASPADHALAEQAIEKLRLLGVQITELGSRPCASPVGRVLAYSRAKCDALVDILKAERAALGDRIRAVVVTDFEKSAAHAAASEVLDPSAGGAVAAFRALLTNEATDALNPVLLTGSTILVDDDLVEGFLAEAESWLAARSLDATLEAEASNGFSRITGRGKDWGPRSYVAMITAMFQAGQTRCLVGTRGMLGEGWDANKTNVLVDLTTVTTTTSVNQLRGRSIRLDSDEPTKVADNWDVICVADEFSKGLDDYERFCRRHATWFGATEDGEVEKGPGHVHAAFTEIEPEGISELRHAINEEMLTRAARRDEARERWRIGEKFEGRASEAIETQASFGGGFPTAGEQKETWSDRSLTLAIAKTIAASLHEAGLIDGRIMARVRARSGGYLRIVPTVGSEGDVELFMTSLEETLGPLERPRYVMPRYVEMARDTVISRLLPEVVGRYFRTKRQTMAMLHAVPTSLGRNKDLVAIFARHWNQHVSPGDPVYAQHGKGERLLLKARRSGREPRHAPRRQEVFR